jgi:dsRNA-specific ribonuclease
MIFRKPRLKLSVKISEINNNDEVRLTCDQYQNLVDFQDLLYNKIFNLNFNLDFTSSQYGGFIVLLERALDDRFNIDFSRANPIGFKQNHLAFLANLTNRGIYLLKELQTDLTPQSPFPRNEYKTYMEYHLIKNGLETKDLQHPLVQVQRLNRNLNFVSNEIKRDVHDTSYRMDFIFEHLVCLAVDYDEFNKLRIMPSILYRLNGLLNARWLKLSIEASGEWLNYANEDSQRATWASSIKYNNLEQYENEDQMHDMNAEDCESALDNDKTADLVDNFDISETQTTVADDDLGTTSSDCDDYDDVVDPPVTCHHQSSLTVPLFSIAEDDANLVLPNVFEILQCLTLRHVNDSFDLERYEVLGDCFLKLSVSHYIYTRLNKTNEGNLTFLKSQRVSNRYLYKLACRKDLQRFVNACAFNAKTNWLAPNHKANIAHVISDKSLADVVEALIGLYLSKCGTIGARKLMNWLEFTISSDHGLVDFNEPYEMPSPLVSEITKPEERLELEGTLKRRYEAFQHRIDYKFSNLFYLLQAFTHPSYTSNRYTCSYQRLEFLGDAVLDLLITQYLFCINKEYSPGLLHLFACSINGKNGSYSRSLQVK